jgi:SAM-dependent methyltransferase
VDQALSFGTAADQYDRYRPSYAAEAVRWALGENPLRVADLGAGTGILSRLVRGEGHEVVAIEPDGQMRARLHRVSPDVPAFEGTAEEIPLPDASVDAVVAGQSYHWFDTERAHPEIARVLRSGGVFAAFWNDADLDVSWTVQLAEIIDGSGSARGRPRLELGERFGPVTGGEFRHELWLTPDELVGLAMTRSPYLVGTPEQRSRLVGEIRALLATDPALAGRERFAMPHLTRVQRAARV